MPMMQSRTFSRFAQSIGVSAMMMAGFLAQAGLTPAGLRTEYLENPLGIDGHPPRLSWVVESTERNQQQTAYQVVVASDQTQLAGDKGYLWNSGKIQGDETLNVSYAGKPLRSGQQVYWKVKVWDKSGAESAWSPIATWSMGLLHPEDWKAEWISFRDTTPLHTDRNSLFLPPARHYRKEFPVSKKVKSAKVYGSALGIFELHLNGKRVGDAYFEPGWADYAKRNYYKTHDVTSLLQAGGNAIGAIVADGWYAGYVGYGLLVGYGPNKVGRYFYGKTPAFLAQLEIEFTDGSREVIATDGTWQVSSDGPIREADLIMGEAFDARLDRPDWCLPGGAKDWTWQPAIRASDNGSNKAVFSDTTGDRTVELGFVAPPKMQSYSAPPIRITEELKARKITEPSPGVYIFDLGQNFAGLIRLNVKGAAGTKVKIRYGEMLHPDGRLMTENLRRARAIDFYTLRGDSAGETWTPRFTYHGFQFVELSGIAKPGLDAVTGLVLHNDTPLTGSFECSDELLTKFATNVKWTQRANFIEIPTDCPQRDERLGWMGDAQVYVRTATYNADVAAFFTKWLDDVEESQRSFGAYPDYAPYPMSHGAPNKPFGTAWTDAGIICPWTVWKVYDDTRVIERHWNSMTRFMDWRAASTTPEGLGTSIGNTWGDWLNVNESTPIEFIDTCYHAYTCQLMAEMAKAIGRDVESANYRSRFQRTKGAFNQAYVNADGSLKVDTQTAYALAIQFNLLPGEKVRAAGTQLARKIEKNEFRMATGFLGTKQILPALTAVGQHDVAVRLWQSRHFPSWGYEVLNGANSVWERWDSFTKEHGFNGRGGNQNAAMNSFSHYAFGSVMEWVYRHVAGIDTEGAGYKRIVIAPWPPAPNSNPEIKPVHWAKAAYDSPRGKIKTAWKQEADRFELDVTIPANTTATVSIPAESPDAVQESSKAITGQAAFKIKGSKDGKVLVEVGSGDYHFVSKKSP